MGIFKKYVLLWRMPDFTDWRTMLCVQPSRHALCVADLLAKCEH